MIRTERSDKLEAGQLEISIERVCLVRECPLAGQEGLLGLIVLEIMSINKSMIYRSTASLPSLLQSSSQVQTMLYISQN